MNLGYARGKRVNQQFDYLEAYEVEEIFSDGTRDYEVFQDPESNYQRLLDYAEPGDCLVITSLEVISRDYQKLLSFLDELDELELDIVVLTSPNLTLMDWREVFFWVSKNDRLLHPRLIKMKLKQEKNQNKQAYSVFSGDSESRYLYREVMWQLIGKQKLRKISEQKGVPIETIYRIQQEFKRLKLALILAMCFILAITTIKISENFSDNLWIQVAVCVITTLAILYNTLADNEQT
ncbi:recombinase family protein [Enterococcus quebecensis]|uniref:Resolvase/invertase-type recombinase catalytic domain-containing protein n=1 Tax=Enterococcus quebecensis TaxID=903983 RepID=A0A1E5GXH1_9ENTE|nr:recombinase family protein [Enterococcus quebecensis]OEG17010.1 hypothetical protein BCR23_03095 [Enterococcus quebecensis]OJG75380.1 hypothetical protein RV12_GL001183 [Enterococcus quebecensis]